MSTFRGLGEVIAENGLFCSLYADAPNILNAAGYLNSREIHGVAALAQQARMVISLGMSTIEPAAASDAHVC